MTISTYSFPSGYGQHLEIEDAVEKWDSASIPGTSFGSTHGNGYITTQDFNDNINSIVYGGGLPSGTVAATHCRYNLPAWLGRDEYRECDIVLSDNHTFPTNADHFDKGDNLDQADEHPMVMVILHEMGHVAGLDHSVGQGPQASFTSYTATMDYWGAGSTIGDTAYLQRQYFVNENDREGLRDLYFDSSNDGVDLAVQSYTTPDEDLQYLFANNGNSICIDYLKALARPEPRVDLLGRAEDEGKPPGSCPSNVYTEPLPTLLVNRGSSFEVAFSFLNLGNNSASSIPYRYILSTSPTNPTSGTWYTLYSGSMGMGPNQPYEKHNTLTVPTGASTYKYYYLWAVVDYGNSFPNEWEEGNNEAVWNRRLYVFP